MRLNVLYPALVLSALYILINSTETEFFSQPSISIQYQITSKKANDLCVSSEGDTYIIDQAGRLNFYDLPTGTYQKIEGDRETPRFGKLDCDGEGTPYVISETGGQMFHLDNQNNWIQLPGCANDIAVGRGGEVWKIGCDQRLGGFGVWKLFCHEECKGNKGRCTRFRPMKYPNISQPDKRVCNWFRIEGAGVRIAVDPQGNPWTIGENHRVYHYDGVNWKNVPGFSAQDIAISNDGVVFVSADDGNSVGRLVCDELGTWQNLKVSSKSIAVGPFSLFTSIAENGYVISTSKRDFN